jgi:predicted Fe-Mo cluster-binding NifX family protein
VKIALTATGKDLDCDLDPRFGRAARFIIVDTDSLGFEIVENQQNLDLPQGAGIQAGKTVVETGAQALITGNCGPKAFKVLQQAGVEVYTGVQGKIGDLVARFREGRLKASRGANVEGHWV